MSNTSVSFILKTFPKLESLDLSFCRSLSRGFKHRYSGREELDKLLDDLKKMATVVVEDEDENRNEEE